MDIINKDLNLLTVFTAIWEERNLSRAAERLYLSQPAVSHALNRLREQFDDPLFVRSSKGVTPTAFAESMSGEIISAVRKLEALYEKHIPFDPATCENQLVLSIGDYFSAVFLDDFLSRLHKLAPGVTVICRPDSEAFDAQSFERGEIHIGITGFQTQLKEGFHIETVVDDTVTGVCSKKNPNYSEPMTLENYLEMEHVFISSIGSTTGLVDKKLKSLKKKRNVTAVVPGFFEVGSLLKKTNLVLSGPNGLCLFLAKRHGLSVFELPFAMPGFPIGMHWHERTQYDPFFVWIREQIRFVADKSKLVSRSK